MLVSYTWKVVFLLLSFVYLGFNLHLDTQLLQLMCPGKIVFFLPKVVFLFAFVFSLLLWSVAQCSSSNMKTFQPSSLNLSLPPSLCLSRTHYLVICMLDNNRTLLMLYSFFFNLFSSVFFRKVLSTDLSLSLHILFFLPSQVCYWNHLVNFSNILLCTSGLFFSFYLLSL